MSNPDKQHINPHFKKENLSENFSVNELAEKIKGGDRVALARAITITESDTEKDELLSSELIELLLPFSGKSKRFGITGVPGAGKSTFIEYFGKTLTAQNKKVAVLAVDPSSTINKGSILGDKTRMNDLSVDPLAFIRPSPSGGNLGGVARKTRETIILCEAAGYENIIIETVGVGQSETEVHRLTDIFILLMIPGAGDELQGIKRGIMEMADVVVINKDDGENSVKAKKAKQDVVNALHFLPPAESGFIPKVESCSALEGKGIESILLACDEFFRKTVSSGYFDQKRKQQALSWLDSTIQNALKNDFQNSPDIRAKLPELREKVSNSAISPFKAAGILLKTYKK